MNTTKIFQTSWSLSLRYRAMWVFGVILALTTISIGSLYWLGGRDRLADEALVFWEISAQDQAWIKENFGLNLPLTLDLDVEDLSLRLDDPSLSASERARRFDIAKTVIAIFLFLLGVTLVLRYTAEAALIKMVNDQQNTNEVYGARKGWSLGFSEAGLKLFLIDLLVFPLLITLTLLFLLPTLFPVLFAINGSPAAISISVILMIALMLVYTAAMMLMWVAGIVVVQLAHRACCLDGLGVFASIWRGFRLLRAQLRGIGLTWLVIVGLEMVYPILLVPIGILLAAAGLVVGGFLALILGALLTLVLMKTIAWTIAVVTGFVLVVLIVAVPLTLLDGLFEVLKSSAWTLTFREAAKLQDVGREPAPAPRPAIPQAGAV